MPRKVWYVVKYYSKWFGEPQYEDYTSLEKAVRRAHSLAGRYESVSILKSHAKDEEDFVHFNVKEKSFVRKMYGPFLTDVELQDYDPYG